jgi:purine nucleoside permease
MALGMDTRFDLSKAYWVIAGIAGINPAAASVGSAAWAEWVVDRDLNFEIDAREIPEGWSTGHVPLGRKAPFEQPAPPISGSTGTFAYRLNGALVDWAYRTTRDTPLDDTKDLQAIRRGYPDYPNAQKPPFVLKGDNAAASDFWIGARMNDLAIGWVDYWTHGKGRFVTTAMEDAGMLQSLTFLAQAKRADLARVLLLRTGANYTLPPEGETAARMLAHEAGEDAALSAYLPSLEAAYRVGSRVVTELAGHWERYETTRPDEVTP